MSNVSHEKVVEWHISWQMSKHNKCHRMAWGFTFHWVMRDANLIAHELAKAAA